MIKIYTTAAVLLLSLHVFAQDTLVLFDRIYPNNEISSFPDYWQGIYENESGVTWEVTSKSINSISNLYMAFTRDELLSKEGYSIKNGLLYGFVESDSIPVLERNDSVFFAYRHRKELFEVKQNNALVKDGQELIFYRYKKTTLAHEMIWLRLRKGILEVYYLNTEKVLKDIENFRPTPSLEDGEFLFYNVKNKRRNFNTIFQEKYFERGMALEFEEKLD